MSDDDRTIPEGVDEGRVRELAEQIEREGWTWSPLVVHGDQHFGEPERYEAARFLGMEKEVPTVSLEEIYEEAGMDMPQIATPDHGDPEREFFEDYLRGLPGHLRDKYEI